MKIQNGSLNTNQTFISKTSNDRTWTKWECAKFCNGTNEWWRQKRNEKAIRNVW